MAKKKPYKKPTRKIMRSFTMSEISAVDAPAQEGAVAVILKRKSDDEIQKGTFLLSSVDGHSHLIMFDANDEGGHTSWETAEDDEMGHSHPWVLNSDQSISIGDAAGHGHTIIGKVARVAKSGVIVLEEDLEDDPGRNPEEDPMATKKVTPTGDDKLAQQIDDLTARVEKAEAFGKLNDEQKTHYETLDEKGQAAYLKMSPEDRAAEIAKRSEDDPVVYKDSAGQEYRKSDDPRMVVNAKRSDKAEKRAEEAEAARANESFNKRAETELANLPGTVEHKSALLKAIDGLDEDEKTAATGLLKAANAGNKGAFVKKGEGGGDDTGEGEESPEAKLEKLAKAHREAHPEATEAVAMDAVLKTKEGAALYDKTIQQ